MVAVAAVACSPSEPVNTNTGGLKIGYVKADSLTQLYDYHKELEKQFEQETKKIEAELVRGQQNLQTEYQVLEQAAPSLSKIELQRAQRDFQRIQQNYSTLEQQRSGELAEQQARMNKQIKEQMDEAMAQLAKEENYDLILIYEENVLYGNEAMDVTQKVAVILNTLKTPTEESGKK